MSLLHFTCQTLIVFPTDHLERRPLVQDHVKAYGFPHGLGFITMQKMMCFFATCAGDMRHWVKKSLPLVFASSILIWIVTSLARPIYQKLLPPPLNYMCLARLWMFAWENRNLYVVIDSYVCVVVWNSF